MKTSPQKNPDFTALCTELEHLETDPWCIDAARAYNALAMEHHGEFSLLNLIPEKEAA